MKYLLILSLIIILPGCAETELASHAVKKVQNQVPIPAANKSVGRFKVGSSYRIKGKRYSPRETYNFEQTGIASWYGPNFHGKMTANGEIFDKYELTAAHKTLQMPSIVRVTNLENGRSIILRINDRGPFSGKRIIDLSERSAELLDFKHKGVAKVKVQVLPQESLEVARIAKSGGSTRGYEVALNKPGYQQKPVRSSPRSAPVQITKDVPPPPRPISKPNTIFVQAGSFTNVVKARALAQRIEAYGPSRIASASINGNQYYRVQLGPLQDQAEADRVMSKLASSNIGEPILVRE